MVAGGGASVIYSDTICDLGGARELANYGEYSGSYPFSTILLLDVVDYVFCRCLKNTYFA